MNIHRMKQEICEIGDRLYKRGFAAANDGNITYRVSENEVLCTPTMHCKGFLKPEDICIVDMNGKQLAGAKKRSSEALLHLEIMKARPDVKSVVHCHPPHATAFAVAHEAIPQCILPEVEVFLGDVPITKYETPGGKAFAETILPFVDRANVIILANHGTVSYGENVERAYWWTEILDAYCRILLLVEADRPRRVPVAREEHGAAGAQEEVGLHRPAARRRLQELRHLRERRLPRLVAGRRRARAARSARRAGRRPRPATRKRSCKRSPTACSPPCKPS